MIPIRLTVTNFMSYGSEPQALDFDGLHLFCLSGQNGHGKSSLLDAMTWVLFGRTRASTEDELLHAGSTEMSVVFEFQVSGVTYKAARLRSVSGHRHVSKLDLFTCSGGNDWHAITGNAIRETEAKIARTLGMTYNTFINSAFLLQGRADEFTVKTPSERKEVLAAVLDLEVYQRLSERAKGRTRMWTNEAQAQRGALAAYREQAERLPTAQRRLDGATALRHDIDLQLPPEQQLLDLLKVRWELVRQQREERAAIDAQRATIDQEIQRQQAAVAQQTKRQHAAAVVLNERETIVCDYDRLLAARNVDKEHGERLTRLMPLQRQSQTHQRAIDAAAAALQQEHAVLQAALTEAGKRAGLLPALEQQHAGQLTLVQELRTELDRLQGCLTEQQQVRVSIAGAKASIAHLEGEVAKLRTRYKAIEAGGATCPTCGQPLTDEQRAQLRDQMTQDAGALKNTREQEAVALKGLEDQDHKLAAVVAALPQATQRLDGARQTEAKLRHQVADASKAVEDLAGTHIKLQAVQQRIDAKEFAADARAQLASVVQEIERIAYDAAAHAAARDEAKRLAPAEKRRELLLQAEGEQSAATALIEQAQQQVGVRTQELTALTERAAALDATLAANAGLDQQLREQQTAVNHLAAEQQRATIEEGAATEAVHKCQQAQLQAEQCELALRDAVHNVDVYGQLADDFGRNGVQAILIDEAIPTLAAEANYLLHLMSNGEITLDLDTQRTNQRDRTIETLDIRISDAQGTRNYEMYSGGEAFRINFALRIALSKLLAKRAGTPLQTLIIDEGFGSQDANGRDHLQQALAAIASDFACVIVITHLDELKDWFPERVEVVKDDGGSRIYRIAS